jgi:hypothetical protein
VVPCNPAAASVDAARLGQPTSPQYIPARLSALPEPFTPRQTPQVRHQPPVAAGGTQAGLDFKFFHERGERPGRHSQELSPVPAARASSEAERQTTRGWRSLSSPALRNDIGKSGLLKVAREE